MKYIIIIFMCILIIIGSVIYIIIKKTKKKTEPPPKKKLSYINNSGVTFNPLIPPPKTSYVGSGGGYTIERTNKSIDTQQALIAVTGIVRRTVNQSYTDYS